MFKKTLALVLTCVMMMALVVFTSAEDTVWPTLAERAQMKTKIEKLTDEPVTLTMWFDLGSHDITDVVSNVQDLDILKTLEEKTGVHIELIVPPTGEGDSNFSLMLTSGKYADIIIAFDNFYAPGGDAAIEEGIILDLKDLVEKYAPHYQAVRTASTYREINTTTDSGAMPYFCNISFQDRTGKTYGGPIIRQDILDRLGMETPVTFDDWHKFLTRAKNELNMSRSFGLAHRGIAKYNALNSAFDFAMNDPAQGGNFYVKDGTVCYGPLADGYLPYVTLMHQWYKEGLIDPDFTSTITFDDGIAMMSSDLCAATSEHGGVLDYLNGLGKSVNPDFSFIPIANPVLEVGQQLHYGYISGGAPIGKAAAISTACKNPELAVRFIDQLYTDEGFMLCNYGTEGKSYELINGEPVFTDLILNNEQGTTTHMMCAYAAHIAWPFEGILGREDTDILAKYAETWDSNNDYSYSFPSGVTPTKEENEIFGDYYPDIQTYVDETTVRFIMGLEPLENYPAFIEQLHALGIDEVLAAQQSAYDRYINRAE
jgi:putative aldouronate transport system substrate-binding protein